MRNTAEWVPRDLIGDIQDRNVGMRDSLPMPIPLIMRRELQRIPEWQGYKQAIKGQHRAGHTSRTLVWHPCRITLLHHAINDSHRQNAPQCIKRHPLWRFFQPVPDSSWSTERNDGLHDAKWVTWNWSIDTKPKVQEICATGLLLDTFLNKTRSTTAMAINLFQGFSKWEKQRCARKFVITP